METFEQRLAEAEEAVYGQRRRRDGAERTARESWRKSENVSRERWRRREGDGTEREHRRGNVRDPSPGHEERYHGRGRDERREDQRKEDMLRDKDKGRERDGSRRRERSTDEERDTERRGASSAFERCGSSAAGSHSGLFLKPSEDDSRGEAVGKALFPSFLEPRRLQA